MAYTESFSMLLLVTFLLLLVRERWWLAGATALVLGLTRPIALPLVVVVRRRAVDAVAGARPSDRSARRERVAMVGALGATGLSGILWTDDRRGRRRAARRLPGDDDRVARRRLDRRSSSRGSARSPDAWETHDKVYVLPALGIVVPLVLSLLMLVPRIGGGLDLRLRVWSAAYSLYLLAVVDGHTSIFRYLVPLFPLAVLLVGAHRARPRWWQLRTAFWVAVGVVGPGRLDLVAGRCSRRCPAATATTRPDPAGRQSGS